MKRTGAVIVAAGLSSRMGDFKPLLKIGNISVIERIIINFKRARVSPIVVVTGHHAEELEKHLSTLEVICVRNEAYATTEMFDSAKIGFSVIQTQCERTFFTPVDIPLFTDDTVSRMMETEAAVVKPVYRESVGHPILISCELLPEIMEHGEQEGLRQAIVQCSEDIRLVAVEDEGILYDADTPKEYQKLVEAHSRQMFRSVLEVTKEDGRMVLEYMEPAGQISAAGRLGAGNRIPGHEEIAELWNICKTPDKVRGHCLAVAEVCLEMEKELEKNGVFLSRKLLRAAALLHDGCRAEGRAHAKVMSDVLKERGYTRVAAVVAAHHGDFEQRERLDEKQILYLADKLVDGTKRVSLEERFAKSAGKCLTPEAMQMHDLRYERARAVMRKLKQAELFSYDFL